MTSDLSKILFRFTLFFSIITTIICVIFFGYTMKQNVARDNQIHQDNLSKINTFIDDNTKELGKIINKIYNDKYFQTNLTSYGILEAKDYIESVLNEEQSPTYLRNTLQNYINDNNQIRNINIVFNPSKNLSLFKNYNFNRQSNIQFSTNLNFLTNNFPDNRISFYASLDSLHHQLKDCHYRYIIYSVDGPYVLGGNENEQYLKEKFVALDPYDYKNFKIKSFEDSQFIKRQYQHYVPLLIFSIILITISIYGLLKFSFNNYFIQYNDILHSLKKISTQPNKQTLKINTFNKTGDLKEIAEHINSSFESRDNLLSEQYKNELLKKEAEFSSLQTHINPHFLFNNLEFIRMKALLNNDEEVSQLIYLLSQLYRNNTYQPATIGLDTELENVGLYLDIFTNRYKHHFTYSIENTISGLTIPKLSIQPIVENYIKHGMDTSQTSNIIQIICEEADNNFTIIIKDNGKGMPINEAESLQEKVLNHQDTSEHIGLSNVYQRLCFFYDQKIPLVISSAPQKGFCLEMTIAKGVKKIC